MLGQDVTNTDRLIYGGENQGRTDQEQPYVQTEWVGGNQVPLGETGMGTIRLGKKMLHLIQPGQIRLGFRGKPADWN